MGRPGLVADMRCDPATGHGSEGRADENYGRNMSELRTEPTPLETAVREMLIQLAAVDTDNVWEHFTCLEIEAIANVARVAGRRDVADQMIELHHEFDPEGCQGVGETHGGLIPMVLIG